jgi:NADH:ubiquinone oxidoreductase subunit K
MTLPGVPVVIIVAGALFAIGLAGLIARSHLIKMVMGLELLGKAVSLLFILGGYLGGDTGVSQAVVFTLIAIEAVIAGVALALVILIKRAWKTFDSEIIFRLIRGDEQ